MRILKSVRNTDDGRTGTFTSGIVSIWRERRIALYFTGWKHAGENLTDVLKRRAADLTGNLLIKKLRNEGVRVRRLDRLLRLAEQNGVRADGRLFPRTSRCRGMRDYRKKCIVEALKAGHAQTELLGNLRDLAGVDEQLFTVEGKARRYLSDRNYIFCDFVRKL